MRNILKLSALALAATLTATAAFASNDLPLGAQTPLQFAQSQPTSMVYGHNGEMTMTRANNQNRDNTAGANTIVDRAVGSPNAGN